MSQCDHPFKKASLFLTRVIVFLLFLFFWSKPPYAENKVTFEQRFMSLKVDEVNMRLGPGRRFPIEWQFHYRGLPVLVLQEYDVWMKIRDFEGTEGWVHKMMLSSDRYVLFLPQESYLYRQPSKGSPLVARVKANVVGKILKCQEEWCLIKLKEDYEGWVEKTNVWGIKKEETYQMKKCFFRYLC